LLGKPGGRNTCECTQWNKHMTRNMKEGTLGRNTREDTWRGTLRKKHEGRNTCEERREKHEGRNTCEYTQEMKHGRRNTGGGT